MFMATPEIVEMLLDRGFESDATRYCWKSSFSVCMYYESRRKCQVLVQTISRLGFERREIKLNGGLAFRHVLYLWVRIDTKLVEISCLKGAKLDTRLHRMHWEQYLDEQHVKMKMQILDVVKFDFETNNKYQLSISTSKT